MNLYIIITCWALALVNANFYFENYLVDEVPNNVRYANLSLGSKHKYLYSLLDDATIDFFNVDLPQKCDIEKDKIW
jgi:hypothetical protein